MYFFYCLTAEERKLDSTCFDKMEVKLEEDKDESRPLAAHANKQNQDKLVNIKTLIDTSNDVNDFIQKLEAITPRQLDQISTRTIGQGDNPRWRFYRTAIITGSLVKRVSSAVDKHQDNPKLNDAISKLNICELNIPAIVWGREHEKDGVTAFYEQHQKLHKQLKIFEVGLKLDPTLKILGGSADAKGLCEECGKFLIEIKCSYKFKDTSILQRWRELPYLTDKCELKPNHAYYYQVQTYLGLHSYEFCYFVVWVPADILVVKVHFDEVLWDKIKHDARYYYYNFYLKHFI